MVKDAPTTTSPSGKRRSKPGNADSEDDGDDYKKFIEQEEETAKSQDPLESIEDFFTYAKEVKSLLVDIYDLKNAPTENAEALEEKRRAICVLVTYMKRLNRFDKLRMMGARDKLTIEKQRVETIHLQYHNLSYEFNSLNTELMKCKKYVGTGPQMDLISVADFMEEGPLSVTKKFRGRENDLNMSEMHELHMAMLEYELSQRIKLAELLEQLGEDKKRLQQEIVVAKAKIGDIAPKLEAIVESARPLQTHLEMDLLQIREDHAMATRLPDALYILYCGIDAYNKFTNHGMTLDISGTLEELKQFEEMQRVAANDSDGVDADESRGGAPKTHRHREAVPPERQEERKTMLTRCNPLSVVVTLKHELGLLRVEFLSLPQLGIVTVKSNFTIYDKNLAESHCAKSVLSGEGILNCLAPNDTGLMTPNTSNLHELKRTGVNNFECLVPTIGHAYEWTQRLCGLCFNNANNTAQKVSRSAAAHAEDVEHIFDLIVERLSSRLHLALQLKHLEANVIPKVPAYLEVPAATASSLTMFRPSSFSNFCTHVHDVFKLHDHKLISLHDMYYEATIARDTAVLNVDIVVKNEYPQAVPLLFVTTKHEGSQNARDSDALRDMERTVNIISLPAKANELPPAAWLLAYQLQHMCACWDIYLETAPFATHPSAAVCFATVRGRNQRRPYKYHAIGNGIFAQY